MSSEGSELAARAPGSAGASSEAAQAAEALKNGPKGALVVSAIAVGILFVGWIAFYFLLFVPRGPIG